MERYARYRAPAESGQKLAVPPWGEIDALVDANVAWRSRHDFELLGRPLAELTAVARREALNSVGPHVRQAHGPWIVTGHQPGLVHPGVWVKNFAAAELAERRRGVSVHVVIDADVCRGPAILVPSGTVDAPHMASVGFDAAAPVVPWEERRIVDERVWCSFPERIHETASAFLATPFLDEWWPTAVACLDATDRLGSALAQSRHMAEVAWGRRNAEILQSRLCQTAAFRWFACTLLAELSRFAAAYNCALADYRRQHHIRNHAHPVPDLASDGPWLEAPFWIWTTADPRRRPVFVRREAGGMLITDRHGLERRLPLATSGDAAAAADELALWEAAGVKLRSRALITTMFTRLAVADVFIHGIGGAKYDEVTDVIAQRFFGATPPAYATISGTLRLPIAHSRADDGAVSRLRNRLRNLKFHPDRELDFSKLGGAQHGQAEKLAAEKRRWVNTPKTPDNADERHRAIVAVNDALLKLAAADRANLEWQLAEAAQTARASRVLDSREFASCLFPRKVLEQFLLDFSSEAL